MSSSKTWKTSAFDLYMRIIFLFPIASVLQNLGDINKILFSMLLIAHALVLIRYRIDKKSFFSILLMLGLLAYSVNRTIFPVLTNNLFFYFPFFVLYVSFFREKRDSFIWWLLQHERFVRGIILIWTVIVGVSVFIPSCYYTKEGGVLYFGSFCGSIFRLGPTAYFIQACVLLSMSLYRRRKDIFFMILPMYCYLMGSSRTYLLIGVCLFTVAWYWYGVKKSVFWITIIPMFAIGLFFLLRSSLMDKIIYTLDDSQYGDFWFRITSSRNVIWQKCLDQYSNRPLLDKLFGNGIDFTTKAAGVWAHNDFIELICSFGIIGLLQYVVLIMHMLKPVIINKGNVPIVLRVCIILSWLINAFFNMHYVYFCCSLSMPFIVLAVSHYYEKERENNATI